MASDNARGDLIRKIRVKIKSVLVTYEANKNNADESYAASVSQSTSTLNLEGVETRGFFDSRKGTAYSLAYVKRAALVSRYSDKAEKLSAEIKSIAAQADMAALTDSSRALQEYLLLYPLYYDLEEAETVIAVAGGKSVNTGVPAFSGIKEKVATLIKKPVTGIDDAAWLIAYQLRSQAKSGSVRFATMTWRDTSMSSPFARYMRESITRKLTEKGGITVSEEKPDMVLTSSYWDRGPSSDIKLFAVLMEVGTGKVRSSAEAVIPASVVKTCGYETRPQNFKEAYADRKVFEKDEVSGGGLTVEAWTDRGDDGIILNRGEIIKVFVRVNRPAYLRFIYHMADGNRALLLDNYYIDSSKVNTVYQIPEEFECVPPFGAETMQVAASTARFESIATQKKDGYDLITETLQSTVTKTRGLKIRDDAKPAYGEKRIVLTTMMK
jgi:hypothetical protein